MTNYEAAKLWAVRWFELLDPAVQADPVATEREVWAAARSEGWSPGEAAVAVGEAVSRSEWRRSLNGVPS